PRPAPMAVRVKICGVNIRPALDAAIAGGAGFVGFNFYPPSPRALTPEAAAALAAAVPAVIAKVGVLVDEPDERIAEILARVSLDMLQLHGKETPTRVDDIRRRFGLPVMKAVKIAEAADLAVADRYIGHADWLLFGPKPPPQMNRAAPPR